MQRGEWPHPAELHLTPVALEVIEADAIAGYPEESCGVLLGRDGVGTDGDRREVFSARPVQNTWPGSRAERYLIPAPLIREVEGEALQAGLEIVGFYHSHPDNAAVPSTFDLEVAWPWYTYLIIGVDAPGIEAGEVRGWQLKDDRTTFLEHMIRVGPRSS